MAEMFFQPPPPARRSATRPDLAEGLEDLLDAVWRAEREWDLDNRIDLAWSLQQRRSRRPPAPGP